jgi:hypothetical protein
MAVFAPIPAASVSTAASVNPGFFNNTRTPYRKSAQVVSNTCTLREFPNEPQISL